LRFALALSLRLEVSSEKEKGIKMQGLKKKNHQHTTPSNKTKNPKESR